MISRYKLKIITWYTVLICIIMALGFQAASELAAYRMKDEIDTQLFNTYKLVSKGIEFWESHTKSTSKRNRSRNRVDGDLIKSYIYDIRRYTDRLDKEYIVGVYRNKEIIYASSKYNHEAIPEYIFKAKNGAILHHEIKDTHYSITTTRNSDIFVVLGYELSTIEDLQHRMAQVFLIVFPFGVLLSIICGVLVTQKSLKVIHTINNTAARISSQNLKERIQVPAGKDEIVALISTLNSMIDRLEQSFVQTRRFSQDAAHEIRTPLTILQGEIEELLSTESCPENIKGKLDSILEEIQYLSSMSNRLLLIHSMDTDNFQCKSEHIVLADLLRDIVQDAGIISSDRDINISMSLDDSAEITGDRELITRLLWNLIDNAIKYNKLGGTVDVSLKEQDDHIQICIQDTGLGIQEKEIPNIFERFYRVDKSRSREQGGTGLGLAICKWIVRLHNGIIDVDSTVSEGSTFTVSLPKHA
jgi:heavy metal sensor kinase